jgi:hypothetical protein
MPDGCFGLGCGIIVSSHNKISRFSSISRLWSAALDVLNSGGLPGFTDSSKIPVDHCPQSYGADCRAVPLLIPRCRHNNPLADRVKYIQYSDNPFHRDYSFQQDREELYGYSLKPKASNAKRIEQGA